MMLLLAAAAAALAALAHAAPTPQAPSLRNGLPGTALAHHRWLSVEAPASGGLAQQHALEASLLAAGVPAHLAWVNDQGALELIVPPALEPAVAELLRGREHSVLRPDAQAWLEMEKEERRTHPLRPGMPKDEFYRAWRTLDEILGYMRDIAEGAGIGVAVNEFVVGDTHEGRPIVGFKIEPVPWEQRQNGTAAAPQKRPDLPKVMMHGCHHSGEWITAMGTVYFFEQLVTGYGEDADMTTLVDNYEWTLIPIVNVDGYEFGWENDNFRTWRKTRSFWPANEAAWLACEAVTPGSCEGCRGTDPNRNWDFMWATVGASDNPCSNSYHGPSPFSETITQVISQYTAPLDLRLYVDHHCCGDMYLQPYGATDELPVAHEDIDSLGRVGCLATDAVHGRNYCSRQGPIYTTIYPASGSSVDYMYAVNNVTYSYGTEMRSSNGNGPADPVLPASEEMWAGMAAMALDLLQRP
jgi:hypothetical protein